ncbi:hypothetical protein RJT34_18409 [Clitoria ternatea]|uniref:Malectin-like domain-containing protein n=1 Tax=Clitoria ternatea TaxID=43366 RepID=A0AAN9JAR2_CLITE
MFRNWEVDYPGYLIKEYPQSISSDYTRQPIYKDNVAPNYTAPANVYLDARGYGRDATEDYNVTWEFQVESKFYYMVRLHFCEFDYHIYSKGDRVFKIFIDDTMAEELADVILWSGGPLIPVYRDYAVIMQSQGSSKKVNLSIKLQRLPKGVISKYRDVLLNVSSLVLLLASIICIIIFFRRRSTEETSRERKTTEGSSLPSHLCRCFTVTELRAATNNFDDGSVVGVGGFGNVYKVYIDGMGPHPSPSSASNLVLNRV